MDRLLSILGFVALNGFWFFGAAIVALLLIRDRRKRLGVLRAALVVGGMIVGLIFVGASLGKLRPLQGFAWGWPSIKLSISYFAIQVASYQILSPEASMVVARILPFAELALGLWLVTGIARRYSSVVASIVLLGFISAITYSYLRGLKIDCGCGIGPPEEAGPAALLRDGVRFFLPSVLLATGSFYVRRSGVSSVVSKALPSTAHAD